MLLILSFVRLKRYEQMNRTLIILLFLSAIMYNVLCFIQEISNFFLVWLDIYIEIIILAFLDIAKKFQRTVYHCVWILNWFWILAQQYVKNGTLTKWVLLT